MQKEMERKDQMQSERRIYQTAEGYLIEKDGGKYEGLEKNRQYQTSHQP